MKHSVRSRKLFNTLHLKRL